MICPVCHLDLTPTDLGAFGLVVVHPCIQCSGAWLQHEEIERLGESVEAEFAMMAHAPGSMQCPECGTAMSSVSPPGENAAQHCTSCGRFWIDQGQVAPVATLVDDENSRVIDRRSVDARPQHWSALRWVAWRLRRCFE